MRIKKEHAKRVREVAPKIAQALVRQAPGLFAEGLRVSDQQAFDIVVLRGLAFFEEKGK